MDFVNHTDSIGTPYFIQTWKLKSEKTKNGGLGDRFHGKFSPDYMGSAEFELGSVPACMKYIIGHLDEYDKIYSNGSFFWIGPNKTGIENYGDHIDKMRDHSLRLKEWIFVSLDEPLEMRRGKPDVMQSELGMDIENCVLFSERKDVIKIAQKALRFNRDNPLNICIHHIGDEQRFRDRYYHESVVTDKFLESNYGGEDIVIEKLNDAGEWVCVKNVTIDNPKMTMKTVILSISGRVEEYFGDIADLKKMKEHAVIHRNSFKRFQIFELKDGNWVQIYNWDR
jgi:hypothetical protein